jgi:hypothetical protein
MKKESTRQMKMKCSKVAPTSNAYIPIHSSSTILIQLSQHQPEILDQHEQIFEIIVETDIHVNLEVECYVSKREYHEEEIWRQGEGHDILQRKLPNGMNEINRSSEWFRGIRGD